MLRYLTKRALMMIPTMLVTSLAIFIVIQLPPGDFVTTLLSRQGDAGVDAAGVAALREQYGLDRPLPVQYATWLWRIISAGDFGYSFKWKRPVAELIWGRLGLTLVVSLLALLLGWLIALPVGIYSAVRQYTIGDYVITTICFVGLAIPNFLLALGFMYIAFAWFGQSVGGIFSPEFVDRPWSMARVLDLMAHIWIPALVIGLGSMAALTRTIRANLLDELGKPYVAAARVRGVPERELILRYPVRVALNPFVSSLAWVLPALVSGETVVSIVLNLPTTGPLLLDALLAQDMYLAGAILLLLALLTVFGVLISDVLLAWLDPRIRYR